MIRVVHPESGSTHPFSHAGSRVKKTQDPGSRIRIRKTTKFQTNFLLDIFFDKNRHGTVPYMSC
jgi:hypothetical protein